VPITILNPASIGSFNVWFQTGGSSKANACTLPDDDDTSFVYLAGLSGTSRQSFNMDSLPSAAKGIQTHTVTARIRRATTSVVTLVDVFLAQSAGVQITTGIAAQPTGSYVNRTETDLASPDGSVGWTPALINTTEVGVHNSGAGADEEERCTSLYWTVTWQPNPSTISLFVASLVGALVGSYPSLADMAALARHLSRVTRGRHSLSPSDLVSLLEEYRAPIRRYVI